jgi:putative salt-induced outer membrane protein
MPIRNWLIFGVTMLPLVAAADDAAPEPPPQGVWTGKGQLGYSGTQGNSSSSAGSAVLDMGLLSDPWEHKLHLGFLYGKSAGIVAAERYDARWQTNYDFTPDLYAFGALRYQRDLFSGFQYQASQTVGVGYKVINTPDLKLTAQAGAGYREIRPEDLIQQPDGSYYRIPLENENSAVGTFGLDYSQQFTSTTNLSNKLLVEIGSNNDLITDTIALTVKMNAHLALSLAYNIQHNTAPPDGLKKTDSTETANLVFSF